MFLHIAVLNMRLLEPLKDCTVYVKVQLSIKAAHSHTRELNNSTPKAHAPACSSDSQNKVFGQVSPSSYGNILDIKILGDPP